MTERLELYKCSVCSNVVEVTNEGVGVLVCCGQNMELLNENIADSSNAHYAIVENIDEITKNIRFNHVMTPEHHIEFIEVISNDGKYLKRKFLEEIEPAQLTFKCDCKEGFYVRLYCNRDGCWKTLV